MSSHYWDISSCGFLQIQSHTYSIDGVVIYKGRIVIPPSVRQNCLSALHAAHQSVSSMVSRVETSIFWPGITTDIHATRTNCIYCSLGLGNISIYHQYQEIRSCNNDIAGIFTGQ